MTSLEDKWIKQEIQETISKSYRLLTAGDITTSDPSTVSKIEFYIGDFSEDLLKNRFYIDNTFNKTISITNSDFVTIFYETASQVTINGNYAILDSLTVLGSIPVGLALEDFRVYDISITSKESVDEKIATAIGESAVADINNNVYVAKDGDDTTGNGTLAKPYLTISAANTAITTATVTNPFTIQISAGVFTEPVPIICKDYISIRGSTGLSTVVKPDTNADVFRLADHMCISMLTIDSTDLVTPSNAGVRTTLPAINSVINNLLIRGGSVGVNCSAASFIKGKDIHCELQVGAGFQSNGGTVQLANCLVFMSPIGFLCWFGSMSLYTTICNMCTTAAISVNSGSTVFSNNATYNNCTVCIRTSGTGSNTFRGSSQVVEDQNSTWNIQQGNATDKFVISSGQIDFNKISSVNIQNIDIAALDLSTLTQEPALRILQELSVGAPNKGQESVFGEGDSYVKNLKVFTTDDTTNPTSDGGNITDVSTDASDIAGSTFTFQGLGSGHSILISADIDLSGGEKVKFWGVKSSQVLASLGGSNTTYALEYWNGSAWVESRMMATESNLFTVYADNVFIRANSDEHIRFGITDIGFGNDWARKSISGFDLYWVRIRIDDNTLTQLPTFNRFKISCSRLEVNSQGHVTHHGLARYEDSLDFIGNVYGETGVGNNSFIVGNTGTVPGGWSHFVFNANVNTTGEYVNTQFSIPRGIDTSIPVKLQFGFKFTGDDNTATGDPVTLSATLIPVRVEGVEVADPAGGKTKIPRDISNAQEITSVTPYYQQFDLPLAENDKIYSRITDTFFISNYYEGDMIFLRIRLDDDGSQANNFIILYSRFIFTKWTPGSII